MALGRRENQRQPQFWTATQNIATGPGHPFYRALNRQFAKAGFDSFVEDICKPYYADARGRPSIPPGTYFRMLMVGYFEGIGSQRGIAWRCSDSLSLREFLGLALSDRPPDHSSLTRIRQRLPIEIYDEVFAFVLSMADDAGLLGGKTFAVDSTTLEANAAMKSIVRRDTGEDWNAYVRSLMAQEGIEEPTDEDVRRFDRGRKGKKVSNKDWESPTDPESRITRMKDGRTHLAYKASHTIDLDTEIIVAADVGHADEGDAESLPGQIEKAEENLERAGSEGKVGEVVADKGYHKTETVSECTAMGTRTYIPERRTKGRRRWSDKPPEQKRAHYGNRRRTRGARGRAMQKKRSERVERSFAHVCETGGGRRAWLCGLVPNRKRHRILVAAHNLGRVMRALVGIGKPRVLQGHVGALLEGVFSALRCICALSGRHPCRLAICPALVAFSRDSGIGSAARRSPQGNHPIPACSTGC